MCSRRRTEREIFEARQAAAEEAENEVLGAEEDVEETKRMLAEGLILANGSQAPPKRKRPSGIRAPGPRARPSAGGDPEAEAAKAAKKRAAEEAAAEKAAAKKAKQDEKAAVAAQKEADKNAKAAAKAAAKKSANANANAFEAGAVVEVSLRLGEAYANWYEARLLELVKGRWKLALQRRDSEGGWVPLLLEGRPAIEWAKLDMLRPLPPNVGWAPSIEEICELRFDDGWWKVRVQGTADSSYTVLYAPANAVHTVTRDRLRPTFTWDAEGQKFQPIKGSGRR